MITKEIAMGLRHSSTLYHKNLQNADKTPKQCRVNGQCKTWKTRPDDFRLPVKHGLYECFYITPSNADDWQTTETIPAPLTIWIKTGKALPCNCGYQWDCQRCDGTGYYLPETN